MADAYLTQEGLDHIKAELKELKKVERKKAIERLEAAKALGDLSENAEYHDAKDRLGWIEGRIRELDTTVKNAVIIEEKAGGGAVGLGSTLEVEVKGQKKTYQIVGSNEADPVHGRISNESPIGSAFMGRKSGEVVNVATPAGKIEYTILKVK